MKETTKIFCKGQEIHHFNKFVAIKKAVNLTRDNGVADRLEIHYSLMIDNKEIVYAVYMIDKKNKIVCALFPDSSFRELMLNQAIASETEQEPDKVIDIVRRNWKRQNDIVMETSDSPEIVSNQ